MYPNPKKILELGDGALYIMGKPTGGEDLGDDIRHLSLMGIDNVVSLLEPREASELGLTLQSSLCQQHDISFHQLPIRDRSTPASLSDFLQSIKSSYVSICAGSKLVAHCRAGIGRSGIYTASVLVASGVSAEEAFQLVSKARGFNVPDTQEQIDWVYENEAGIQNIS